MGQGPGYETIRPPQGQAEAERQRGDRCQTENVAVGLARVIITLSKSSFIRFHEQIKTDSIIALRSEHQSCARTGDTVGTMARPPSVVPPAPTTALHPPSESSPSRSHSTNSKKPFRGPARLLTGDLSHPTPKDKDCCRGTAGSLSLGVLLRPARRRESTRTRAEPLGFRNEGHIITQLQVTSETKGPQRPTHHRTCRGSTLALRTLGELFFQADLPLETCSTVLLPSSPGSQTNSR